MAIPRRRATGRHDRISHAMLSSNRQTPMSVPLILDVIGRPLELPPCHRPTALKLCQQALAMIAQLGVRPVFPPHLKPVEQKPVRDVAVHLVDLFGKRFHPENPPAPRSQGAAELVVVRIVNGVVAVAAVYHRPDEIALAIWCVARGLGFVGWIVDWKPKVVDGA